MFFLPGHGKSAKLSTEEKAGKDAVGFSAASACGLTTERLTIDHRDLGNFAYFFETATGNIDAPQTTGHLDALADAMVAEPADPHENSLIPPVFTYFGQFIDHDITANTDREDGLSVIDTEKVVPLERGTVRDNLKNLRSGALNLDSVHGGGPVVGGFASKLIDALRFHGDRAKLWAGTVTDAGFGDIRPPDDPARDVLRLRDLLRKGLVTEEELRALPKPLRDVFVNEDGSIRVQRAVLGDMRNDENLAVSQFHLAWVRLHNEIVQRSYTHGDNHPDAPGAGSDALFDWGRRRTIWVYQWLVLNRYLEAVCDPETLNDVRKNGTRVYDRFFANNLPARPDLMPLPLEFSVAAFRFGHSMARDAYDWNELFGRPFGAPLTDHATFRQLFEFTGGATPPMPLPGGGGAESLPSHWPIDWSRFVFPVTEETPDRSARRIDTRLALPLRNLINEPEGAHAVLKHLARRNLRRGHRLNVPTAQGCIAALRDGYGIDTPQLSPDQIASGATAEAVLAGGFEAHTPLWFYVLKEAETLSGGQSLGPLGSRIVADTIVGLVRHDPDSFWNAAPGGQSWSPADSILPNGVAITGLPDLMRAAGTLKD